MGLKPFHTNIPFYFDVKQYLKQLLVAPFHATSLFPYPLKTSDKLWFSDNPREHRRRPVVWYGLKLVRIEIKRKKTLFKSQNRKMAKHTQTISRLLPTNCSSVFNHFVVFAIKSIVQNGPNSFLEYKTPLKSNTLPVKSLSGLCFICWKLC